MIVWEKIILRAKLKQSQQAMMTNRAIKSQDPNESSKEGSETCDVTRGCESQMLLEYAASLSVSPSDHRLLIRGATDQSR